MSTFTFRPAKRENTPLIIGVAGPTKSGKTYSAHRLARGMVGNKPNPKIIMLNAEGARGHQYADEFQYIACDIEPPYGPDRYATAVMEIETQSPDALIIDSCSHMHDGPGGLLEWHEAELDRMAGQDYKKRERCTWAAWIKPKAAENAFIYALLGLACPVILCFRAKEKLKIVPGKEPIDLGWQPIAGDRITFETIFTLVLPPHSKGVPDLEQSEMRRPFDTMVSKGKPIDEDLGRKLAEWAKGGAVATTASVPQAPLVGGYITDDQLTRFHTIVRAHKWTQDHAKDLLKDFGITSSRNIPKADYEKLCSIVQNMDYDAYVDSRTNA